MSEKMSRKKEDKKYLIIFICLFVASGMAGFFIGKYMMGLKKAGALSFVPSDEMMIFWGYAVPIIGVVFSLIVLLVSLLGVRNAKKMLATWDGEDETVADAIEGRLGISIILSSVVLVISYYLFSLGVSLDIHGEFSKVDEDIVLIMNVVQILMGIVTTMTAQKLTIDVMKDMNPEKKGSVFDAKFSTKWMASCDEAQKAMVYKAGYTGYQVMGSVCMGLWLVCLVADVIWNVGILPGTMVFIIWISGVIGYNVGAIKAEKM